MKSKLIALLAAGLLAASSAFAGQVLVTSSANRDFAQGGGAFTVDFLPVGGATFQAFCLELSENIGVNTIYDYTLDTGSIRGGNTGPGGSVGFDPLSVGSAWLMSKYNASIPSLPANGFSDAVKSSHTLQDAFWALESEKAWNPNNVFLQEVLTAFGGSIAAAQTSATLAQLNGYGVRVLNITTPGTTPQDANHYRQSLVLYVPDSGTTLILLGCSLGFVGFVSRRFRR